MSATKRSIFREVAVQHYARSRTRDVLPRYIAPPVFLLLWIFCGICLCSLALAWNVHVPTSISGVGAIVNAPATSLQHADQMAVVLLSSEQHAHIQPGAPVQLRLASSSADAWRLTVTEVHPVLLSPAEIRKTYLHDDSLSLLVTQPSWVVIVALKQQPSLHLYNGSIVQAQIEVGSHSLLSMIPVVNTLVGA